MPRTELIFFTFSSTHLSFDLMIKSVLTRGQWPYRPAVTEATTPYQLVMLLISLAKRSKENYGTPLPLVDKMFQEDNSRPIFPFLLSSSIDLRGFIAGKHMQHLISITRALPPPHTTVATATVIGEELLLLSPHAPLSATLRRPRLNSPRSCKSAHKFKAHSANLILAVSRNLA